MCIKLHTGYAKSERLRCRACVQWQLIEKDKLNRNSYR